MTSVKFDTLILGGNSTNALYTLGALQKLVEDNQLTDIRTYVGTSSGSLISTLLAIGFKPLDILTELCFNGSFTKIATQFNFNMIEAEFENIILSKLDYVPTLFQMFNMFNAHVVCVVFNSFR